MEETDAVDVAVGVAAGVAEDAEDTLFDDSFGRLLPDASCCLTSRIEVDCCFCFC